MELIEKHEFFKTLENATWYNNADREIAEDLLLDFPTVDVESVCYCKNCSIHGSCTTEDAFKLARIQNPFCCAGSPKKE